MTGGPPARQARAQERIAQQLSRIGFALPGTLLRRDVRCGRPTCRCAADPPELHGPYWQWTRKIDGKTVTRLLTAEQARRYRAWFDNARTLRELVRKLEALSLEAFDRTETRP